MAYANDAYADESKTIKEEVVDIFLGPIFIFF